MIIGRTEKDNENILQYHDPEVDTVINVKDHPGPIALVPHSAKKESILLAASICTGHSKAPQMALVDVLVTTVKKKKTIRVIALQPEDVRKLMIV